MDYLNLDGKRVCVAQIASVCGLMARVCGLDGKSVCGLDGKCVCGLDGKSVCGLDGKSMCDLDGKSLWLRWQECV